MSSIASIGKMVSGLNASQIGLQVTGHNLANINTPGYIRQQALQHDTGYLNIGANGKLQQIGLGVSITEIRQIRDELADARYRDENSVYQFYTVKSSAITEIESILDEPHGTGLGQMMDDFWRQTQKLSTNPSGVEERLAFIQTAHVMMEKANHIYEGLKDYQYHLNNQVIESVDRINELTQGISDLNEVIAQSEINGDHANDYRDQRNLLVDELSNYMSIEYYEDKTGRMVVKGEGHVMVDTQFVAKIGLKQTEDKSAFVEPVWEDTGATVYRMNRPITSDRENDRGRLLGLLMTRGRDEVQIDFNDLDATWQSIALDNNQSIDAPGNAYTLPKIQAQLTLLIHEMATVVNESLNGEGIDGEAGEPVFVPIKGTQLVPGNIQVNPKLLADGGYNKLGTVAEAGNIGDSSLVSDLLEKWSEARKWPSTDSTDPAAPNSKNTNFMDFYAEFVSEVGREGYQYQGKVREKSAMVTAIDNQRLAMGGVSQDEELSNMLKYQHAYNASARMVNVLDQMMDTIINRM